MRNKMLAVAMATGLTLCSFAATGQAASTDAQQLADLKAQLAALQAKVDALQERTDAQSNINGNTRQDIEALQQAPAKSSSSWADNTVVGGKMYVDFAKVDQTDHGSQTNGSSTGLDISRFYLTVDHDFNDVWSANLTTDMSYSAYDNRSQLYVKKAYVQGKFASLATLRVGSADMPWIPFVEKWYGYRFVEKTLVDRTGFGSSADWGLHLFGGSGVFDYQVSLVNGGGYQNPKPSNHVDFAGRFGVQPIDGLMFSIGAYSGDLGKDTAMSPVQHTAKRFDAMAGWNRGGLRLGAEWFRAEDWHNVTTSANDSASGWSVWSSYDFGRAAVFARYDRVDLSEELDPSLTNTYWNAGIAFPVTKGIKVALVYKDGNLKDNTAIDIRSREIGAWAEVNF